MTSDQGGNRPCRLGRIANRVNDASTCTIAAISHLFSYASNTRPAKSRAEAHSATTTSAPRKTCPQKGVYFGCPTLSSVIGCAVCRVGIIVYLIRQGLYTSSIR